MRRRTAAALSSLMLFVGACGGAEQVDTGSAVIQVDDSAPATPPETVPPSDDETTTTQVTVPVTTYLVNQLDVANRGAETSQQATETGELPVRTFERFELEAGQTVTGIEWLGIYSFCQNRDGVPDPHATAFVVKVFADGTDGPDLDAEPVFKASFDATETNQTLDDTADQSCQNRPESTWAFYRYDVELDEPFVSDGSVNWLMIQAVTPGFDTYWGWQSARGPASLQEFNGQINEVKTGARAYALRTGDPGGGSAGSG